MARKSTGPSLRAAHHSAIIAIRFVFPVPVAIFNASRGMPRFQGPFVSARYAEIRACSAGTASLPASSSQITVSAASTWHQKGRNSAPGAVQCFSSRLVGERTPGHPALRQAPTSSRSSLIVRCGSIAAVHGTSALDVA